jgi:hypothetical protein
MPTISKPIIAPEILSQIQEQFEEEKQVIVHCCFQNNYMVGNLVRIWPSTFLVDKFTGCSSKLIFWENIAVFPSDKVVCICKFPLSQFTKCIIIKL